MNHKSIQIVDILSQHYLDYLKKKETPEIINKRLTILNNLFTVFKSNFDKNRKFQTSSEKEMENEVPKPKYILRERKNCSSSICKANSLFVSKSEKGPQNKTSSLFFEKNQSSLLSKNNSRRDDRESTRIGKYHNLNEDTNVIKFINFDFNSFLSNFSLNRLYSFLYLSRVIIGDIYAHYNIYPKTKIICVHTIIILKKGNMLIEELIRDLEIKELNQRLFKKKLGDSSDYHLEEEMNYFDVY